MKILAWSAAIVLALIVAGIAFFASRDFTDAATRLAYEIEKEAKAMPQAPGSRVFVHRPKSEPEGVTGAYILTIASGADSYLAFSKGANEHWYRTSYHRRFVSVPNRLQVRKSAGESVRITLTRKGEAIELTDAR